MNKAVDKIKTYYESKMGKGLPDYSVMGWESESAQTQRFEILALNVPLQGKKILDVGCGVGNLAEYLIKRNIQAEYTGVDILESMISQAQKKKMGARLLHSDVFKENPFGDEKFDVVYASGIFNLNLDGNMSFLKKAFCTFLELSDDIIAFNLLSNKSLDKEEGYFYYDTGEVKSMIENVYAVKPEGLEIIEGYRHNDFTVIFQKNSNAEESNGKINN